MLFVRMHVLADEYPVHTGHTIYAGQVVALNSSGEVVLHDESDAGAPGIPIGIAGDSVGTLSAKQFTNKAWELGNETAGSTKITVYHGGGSFYIDYGSTADVCDDTTLAIGNILGTDNGYADGTVNNGGSTHTIFRVDNLLTADNNYLDSGIPGPVYQPVGDVDTARKFALVTLLI